MGEVIEKSQPENNIPEPAIEHAPPRQPIDYNEGVLYETELENTLRNIKIKTGFFSNIWRPRTWLDVEWFSC